MKKITFIFLFISIILTTVVYSAFSTQLQISGDAIVRSANDIRITNVTVTNTTNNAYETYNNKYTKDTTSIFVTLPASSTITYQVEITDQVNVGYLVESIEEISNNNSNININIGLNVNDTINPDSTKNFNITFTNNTTEQQLSTLVLKYTFKINSFTVTFDPNVGNVTTSTKEVSYGSTYGDLPTPTREGYIFKGWNTNLLKNITLQDNYGVRYFDGAFVADSQYISTPDLIPIEGGITLYSNQSNVSIYSYDSDMQFIKRDSYLTNTHQISNNAKYIRIEVTKNGGYTDLSITQDINSSNIVKVISNHTLTAIWEKKEATFITGEEFNKKIKQLANQSDTVSDVSYEDTNITSIQRYTNTPSNTTLENAEIVSDSTLSNVPIYAWYNNGIIYYYTESLNPYLSTNGRNMFRNLTEVNNIELNTIDTSKLGSAAYMFLETKKLATIDLSNFKTTGMYDMAGMFEGSYFTALDLSSFNTANVQSIHFMFSNSSNLKNLTFGNKFNLSKIDNYRAMFQNCNSLESLDLSTFDMSDATNITLFLTNANSLKELKTPKAYPTDSSITIDLPKTLYDTNNNAYTILDNSSPTETWLRSNE